MEWKRSVEEIERPAVWIFALRPMSDESLQPILWGLEEEGIPAELREVPGKSAEKAAKQAADGSPLNVGIAIGGAEWSAVLHHRDMPAEKPLFSLGPQDIQRPTLRRLGINAARLVKGEPLVLQDGPLPESDARFHGEVSGNELEELVTLITHVIMELTTRRA